MCENGIAVGVRVHRVSASGEVTKDAEGTVLRSKHGVISGAGAMLTNDLVPTPALRVKLGYDAMFKKVKASTSHVYCFVGMNGTSEELGLRGANLWVLPCDDEYNFKFKAVDDSDIAEFASGGDPWGETAANEMYVLYLLPRLELNKNMQLRAARGT
mgnify:CR=1 FL=1